MELLTLVRTLQSRVDKTKKLIFTLNRESGPTTIEVGVIDKNDGKYILCVPTQTNCAQACRFCHTTRMAEKVAVSNLTAEEIIAIVRESWAIARFADSSRPILVSFMGAGEPMVNTRNMLLAMAHLYGWGVSSGFNIRFGLATMLPERYAEAFQLFAYAIRFLKLPVKVHLSLHYPTTAQRREWMPASATVHESLALLKEYREQTGNPIEIHYTLIAGVNDSISQIHHLGSLAAHSYGGHPESIPVKFLHLNPLPGDTHHGSSPEWVEILQHHLLCGWNVQSEYYISPGADIAASCGMFMTDAYIPSKPGNVQIEPATPANDMALQLHDTACRTGSWPVSEGIQ